MSKKTVSSRKVGTPKKQLVELNYAFLKKRSREIEKSKNSASGVIK